jgi:calcineurin-like phosphoesterase family protein
MIFFTSDTHFSQEKTRTLSKRPFIDINHMDDTMIKNWNLKITKNDTVYHLGDLGDITKLKYLNYKIFYLIKGNGDRNIEDNLYKKYNVIILPTNHEIVLNKKTIQLVHKPIHEKNADYYLFGHIHKLGMIKKRGLNVGMDCHNFEPLSENEVNIYLNFLDNKFDENVFKQ